MHSTFVGLIVLFCTFGGVILGMWLRNILPTHHLEGDSKDTVKVGIGLVASMTALVLGLVTASAKNSFVTVDAELKQTAAQPNYMAVPYLLDACRLEYERINR